MKTIVLSKDEVEVIEQQLAGEITIFTATEKQQEVITKITTDAEDLMRELDAYDELEDSLIQWYYNKYKQQNG